MFHPDSKLRLHHVEVWLGYDGSIRVATNARILAPDGQDTEMAHGYTHRVPVTHPHWRYLVEAIRPAFRAHHESLGLQYTPEEAAPHLHPQGHPSFGPAPALEEPAPVDPDQVRAAITRAKEAELGATIPRHAYPKMEE